MVNDSKGLNYQLAAGQKILSSKILIFSMTTALRGITNTVANERNMQIHTLATLPISFFVMSTELSLVAEFPFLLCIALVFFAELTNTALEVLLDLTT